MLEMSPPEEPGILPQDAHDTVRPPGAWEGPTYYGRPQLKEAPFENWVVGGYIFLAGLSGASAALSTLVDLSEGRPAADTVRRGRYLSLLAPTLGAALLVWDLHTPKRFYNMLRIAKGTSPMSIGTWILMTFSAFALGNGALQFASDRTRGPGWMRRVLRVSQIPAALAGAGLGTYTASLLAATSTPLWAAAPRSMAARFASSSIATAAAALSLLERSGRRRRKLDTLLLAALAAELAGTAVSHRRYRQAGVAEALEGGWGRVEQVAVTGLGTMLPLAMKAVSVARGGSRPGLLSDAASLAVVMGSLLFRVSIMAAGDESARRPEISLRFAQPENLPQQ